MNLFKNSMTSRFYIFEIKTSSVHVFTFCKSYAWVPQLSSVLKDGFQNHTVNVGKGSNMQKNCWTAQDKQGTHEQLSQNIKTVVDHPGNDTQY